MNFEEALTQIKNGEKLTRKSWNNLLFVLLQKGYPEGIPSNKQTADAFGIDEGDLFVVKPYLQARTINKEHVMWSPNNEDVLAEDWGVVK